MRKQALLIFLAIVAVLCAKGQIVVHSMADTSLQSMEDLVRKTLIGNGVLTGEIKVNGSPLSFGTFTYNTPLDLVKEGLVLSTGRLKDIPGPNDSTSTTSIMQTPGDVDLGKYLASSNGDAVSIEFDFIPSTDSICFNYFFASEEYPEYVGKGFNDAFAFFLKGPGYPHLTNIARITKGIKYIPITIDNINYISNNEYFISNHLNDDLKNIPRKARSLLTEPLALKNMEFDGMTKRLRAVAHVTPYEVYTLKIVIADVGDLRYDSGVFLEKESFSTTNPPAVLDTQLMVAQLYNVYSKDSIKLAGLKKHYPKALEKKQIRDTIKLVFHFDTDSFRMSKTDQDILKMAIIKAQETGRIEVRIEGHTDATGAYKHNYQLSKLRAKSAVNSISEISKAQIIATPMADKKPFGTNSTEKGKALNRRVEISIIPL
ncbi:MAG: OmpA family protein [Bacteroidetes bacterium]|nr:OmpA family protein [Bacteroidota bacterium]